MHGDRKGCTVFHIHIWELPRQASATCSSSRHLPQAAVFGGPRGHVSWPCFGAVLVAFKSHIHPAQAPDRHGPPELWFWSEEYSICAMDASHPRFRCRLLCDYLRRPPGFFEQTLEASPVRGNHFLCSIGKYFIKSPVHAPHPTQ